MLLNAYGWWKVSQIIYIVASLVLFGLAAVAGLAARCTCSPSAAGPKRRPGGAAGRTRDHHPDHDRVGST